MKFSGSTITEITDRWHECTRFASKKYLEAEYLYSIRECINRDGVEGSRPYAQMRINGSTILQNIHMKMALWDIAPRSLVEVNQRYRGVYYLTNKTTRSRENLKFHKTKICSQSSSHGFCKHLLVAHL